MSHSAADGSADSAFIWMDGKLRPYHEAQVHVLSHSLHYGSGAFEGVRAYRTGDGRTAIFRAAEHFERLHKSVRIFDVTLPYSTSELVEATRACIKANEFNECYIRPLAYFGNETRGLKLPANPQMHVAIACWRWARYLGGDATQSQGIKVKVASYRRPDVASALPWAKVSGNYINSILARREATKSGCDEAILLDHQGYVAEGSGENIFLVQKGELLTPPAGTVLLGVTRDAIFSLAALKGLKVREVVITRKQLYEADEVFFTGTAAEISPIGEIDGLKIKDGKAGPITREISSLYEKAIRGQLPEREEWLTYV
jgi:branched-chain amino acid aminotransferase